MALIAALKEHYGKNRRTTKNKNKELKTLYLNDDIMSSILGRIPPSLVWDKFAFQCKQSSSLITSPSFINANFQRSSEGIIFMEEADGKNGKKHFSMKFVEEKEAHGFQQVQILHKFRTNLNIISSCNGLILVQNKRSPWISYVINPITKKGLQLPSPSVCHWSWHDLVFIPSTMEFKIVGLVYDYMAGNARTLVIDIRTKDCGSRKIRVPDNYCENATASGNHVALNGALYWTCYNQIVSFDICSETFRPIQCPSGYREGEKVWSKLVLKNMSGFLSFVAFVDDNEVDIWILRDTNKEEWVQFADIRTDHGLTNTSITGSLNNGQLIVFQNSIYGLTGYDIKTRQWRDLSRFTKEGYHHQIHASSLFSV